MSINFPYLNKKASHMTAILNGEEWQNLDVVEKIHDHASSLSHLKDLLVVSFKGAAETWKCFISSVWKSSHKTGKSP